MSEKVKLIIEIPKDEYKDIKDHEQMIRNYPTTSLIRILNGIPLDDDSERAEVQAYFAGQTYGWEEGRKALLDDVKAEIDKLTPWIYKSEVFGILDNIGKTESEVKPNDNT